MVVSASIVLTLGVVHFVYTFWGPNLTPRERAPGGIKNYFVEMELEMMKASVPYLRNMQV